MITGRLIAEIAGLVGEPARAPMLSALLGGRALTATELAFAARVPVDRLVRSRFRTVLCLLAAIARDNIFYSTLTGAD
jgi:hypothetical protein